MFIYLLTSTTATTAMTTTMTIGYYFFLTCFKVIIVEHMHAHWNAVFLHLQSVVDWFSFWQKESRLRNIRAKTRWTYWCHFYITVFHLAWASDRRACVTLLPLDLALGENGKPHYVEFCRTAAIYLTLLIYRNRLWCEKPVIITCTHIRLTIIRE